MKRIQLFVLLTVALLSGLSLQAQNTVRFTFFETAPDNIRQKMATNATALFTEINTAESQNRALRLSTANLTNDAISRIMTMWDVSHFFCTEVSVSTRVMATAAGYEVRGISTYQKEAATEADRFQDMVIQFDRTGRITDLFIALPQHQVAKFLASASEVTDMRQRQILLDFVENFRTAYNRKDINMIEKMFSDEALIITGTVIKTKPQNIDGIYTGEKQRIKYNTKNKQEYLSTLRKCFKANEYINLKFEDIVVQQGSNGMYGVILKQHWNSTNYSDVGWLFLAIDCSDPNNLQIWVRTWQPEEAVKSQNDVFNLYDFNFK